MSEFKSDLFSSCLPERTYHASYTTCGFVEMFDCLFLALFINEKRSKKLIDRAVCIHEQVLFLKMNDYLYAAISLVQDLRRNRVQ